MIGSIFIHRTVGWGELAKPNIFGLLLFSLSGCSPFQETAPLRDGNRLRFSGTVSFMELAGGAWVLKDNGTTYEPINLPRRYQEEGLKVYVVAKQRSDLASYLRVGPIIEIIEMRRLGHKLSKAVK